MDKKDEKLFTKILHGRKRSEPGGKHIEDIRRLQYEIFNDLEELKRDNIKKRKEISGNSINHNNNRVMYDN